MTRRGALGRASPGEPKVDGKFFLALRNTPIAARMRAARGMSETPERRGCSNLNVNTTTHLILRAEHHRVPRISLAHLAQVHSLVSPCQLVRLVNLDVAPRAQLGVVVEAEHRRRGVVAERTVHHGAGSNPH